MHGETLLEQHAVQVLLNRSVKVVGVARSNAQGQRDLHSVRLQKEKGQRLGM